jgi:hypothetical protein
MPTIDLRKLLNHSLVANSNEPVEHDGTDDTMTTQASTPNTIPRNPRDSPRAARDARRPTSHAGAPVRPHRALRPRRRS